MGKQYTEGIMESSDESRALMQPGFSPAGDAAAPADYDYIQRISDTKSHGPPHHLQLHGDEQAMMTGSAGSVASSVYPSTVASGSTAGTAHLDGESMHAEEKEKKEKRSKKEKKFKKEKKKKKKKKKKEALLEGALEGELDVDFDRFLNTARPELLIKDDEARKWTEQKKSEWNEDGFALNQLVAALTSTDSTKITPQTQSTSSYTASRKTGYDGPPSVMGSRSHGSSKGSGSISEREEMAHFHGEMLQTFLARNGQDEKMALATAMAFEHFIMEQEGSAGGSGTGESADKMSGGARPGSYSDDEDSDDDEDGAFEVEAYEASDVSTLGFSMAEQTEYGKSWSNWTYDGSAKDSLMMGNIAVPDDTYADQRRSFEVGRQQRRVPNLVAGASQKPSLSSSLPPNALGAQEVAISAYCQEERSFEEQMASLSIQERNVVNALKVKWLKSSNPPFPNMWYLKFARCSPGNPFTFKTAYKSMKKYDQRYMNLSIATMESQIRIKMLFPIRGLKSVEGHDMFYMRPSRYFPKKMSTSSVINNLIYVMDCMMEKENAQRDGIGFVANMTDWSMSNFAVSYCYKFMMGLQATKSPTRVQYFLIVNPPNWFGNIWSIMKPMLHPEFRKKVHMIPFADMKKYLAPGFEALLPDDMFSGLQNTNKLIEDFILERRIIESRRMLSSAGLH